MLMSSQIYGEQAACRSWHALMSSAVQRVEWHGLDGAALVNTRQALSSMHRP